MGAQFHVDIWLLIALASGRPVEARRPIVSLSAIGSEDILDLKQTSAGLDALLCKLTTSRHVIIKARIWN